MDIDDLKNEMAGGSWKPLIMVGLSLFVLVVLKPWAQIGAGERGIILIFGRYRIKFWEKEFT